jgi:hypothetical protein
MLGGLVAVLLATAPAWAGQIYMVGGDTGTTITDGVAKLQSGDTLRILPGTYHATINVPCDNVTIEGAGPGVILDGSVTLTAQELTPAAERPGVFTWQLPADADTQLPWIFYEGKPMIYTKAPLNPAKQAWCFYVDQKSRQLEVVFDGKGIPAGASIQVPTLASAVHGWGHKQLTIRGLEVYRTVGEGIGCDQGTIEDNMVICTGLWGIAGGEKSTIVRNTIKYCNGPGVLLGGGAVNVENNLIVANGAEYADYMTWCGSNVKTNALSFCTFQQNWVLDRVKGGLVKFDGQSARNDGKPVLRTSIMTAGMWPDCDCFNNNYVENAVARQSHAGIYIEAGCNRNIVMANDVQDCAMGITLRTSSDGVVTRNWVWDHECLGWGTVDKEGFCGFGPGYHDDGTPITQPCFDVPLKEKLNWVNMVTPYDPVSGSETYGRQMLDGLCLWQTIVAHKEDWCEASTSNNVLSHNLVQVSGMTVSVPLYQREWPSAAERKQTTPLTTFTNQLIDNYYTLPVQKTNFALLGHTKVKTFEAYRQLSGWDGNAQVGNFTPAVLGLEPIWTIPGLAVDNTTPVSILHDPSLETMSILTGDEPLFWHGSYVRPSYVTDVPVTRYERDRSIAHTGRCYISVTNTKDATLDRPLGWYSSAIPVKPGITMGLNLWMAADKLQGAKDGSGARVSFRFTDATGHLVGESPVVGDGIHPELLTGSYKWANVSGQAVVPAGAYWMIVYLGADLSTGTVRYDDIHINLRNPVPPQFPCVK